MLLFFQRVKNYGQQLIFKNVFSNVPFLLRCDWVIHPSISTQKLSQMNFDALTAGPKPMGGLGAERPPPADHLSENFALLSEFLCSK